MFRSSTIYNPFLYGWLNENFRKEFRLLIPWIFSMITFCSGITNLKSSRKKSLVIGSVFNNSKINKSHSNFISNNVIKSNQNGVENEEHAESLKLVARSNSVSNNQNVDDVFEAKIVGDKKINFSKVSSKSLNKDNTKTRINKYKDDSVKCENKENENNPCLNQNGENDNLNIVSKT